MYEDGQKMLRTIFGRVHVMINMVGNLQVSSHCDKTLFFRQHVQPEKRIFDVCLSHQPLQKRFWIIVSLERTWRIDQLTDSPLRHRLRRKPEDTKYLCHNLSK
jgi:hypothetical protein